MPVVIPPAVSPRNHFSPLLEIVESALSNARDEGNIFSRDQLADLLMHVSRLTARACSDAFATAAQRGIQQAEALIKDPEYFATIKRRRKRHMERRMEYDAQQKLERAERDHDPEFRKRHIEDLHGSIDYQKAYLARLEGCLTEYLEFCKTPPKLTRMPAPEKE